MVADATLRAERTLPEAALDRPRVLLAHGNADCRKIYGTVLGFDGFAVDTASDLESAIGQLSVGHYDVVVSDLYLSSRGDECLIRVMKGSAEMAHLPVVVLTGWTTESHRKLALELGAERFLGLPIRPRELSAILDQVLGRSPARLVQSIPPLKPTEPHVANGL